MSKEWFSYFKEAFQDPDPWEFRTSDYEQERYNRLNWIASQYHESPENILELGCAEGAHTELLLQCFPEAEIIAIDYAITAIKRAQESVESERVSFILGDFIGLIEGIERNFDIIVLTEAMYTIGDNMPVTQMHDFISELINKLNRGGVLCISNLVEYGGDTDALDFVVERPILESYHSMISAMIKEVHYSEHSEFKQESNNEHVYAILMFKKR